MCTFTCTSKKIFFITLYAEADFDLLANELIYDFRYKEDVLCLYIILRGIVFSVCCLLQQSGY